MEPHKACRWFFWFEPPLFGQTPWLHSGGVEKDFPVRGKRFFFHLLWFDQTWAGRDDFHEHTTGPHKCRGRAACFGFAPGTAGGTCVLCAGARRRRRYGTPVPGGNS